MAGADERDLRVHDPFAPFELAYPPVQPGGQFDAADGGRVAPAQVAGDSLEQESLDRELDHAAVLELLGGLFEPVDGVFMVK
ncbi:hypothetical protein PMR94_06990 [Bifidobacterium longum]|nr:hypothetical protein [Bifidobacterium longum]MDB6756300.1 hypothetical protein [Bifidobacterium longum]MDB6758226.1 hypothetical protein [Bifidobacterium longum]MDB6760393.1 hypothetical protein [Bifidobacterium longum]MDB6761966.1 hypothetical protein [Bifidobacterium longum]